MFCVGCFMNGYSQMTRVSSTQDDIMSLSWEIAFPTNNNYLTKTSFAGGRFEYRKMIKPTFSVGLAVSWNSFDQYFGTNTYQTANGAQAVTTDMVRQIYTVPITATAHYYPQTSNKILKPFFGLGVGTEYAEQNSYFNIYALTSNNWGFVVRPEIGTLITFNHYWSGLITGSYNYATNKNNAYKISGLSQWALNIGIAWRF